MERVPNRAPLARGVMLGLCIMGLVGCGGGGGGGNVRSDPPPAPSAPDPVTPTNPTTPTTPPVAPAPNAIDAHLYLTNTYDAQRAGLTGAGQGIVFFDSGLKRNDLALAGRVKDSMVAVDAARNDLSVDDAIGHGTSVAQIAAGSPVGGWPRGIAPRADLYSVRTYEDALTDQDARQSFAVNDVWRQAMAWSADKGRIVDISGSRLHWSDPRTSTDLVASFDVLDQHLIVAPTGDDQKAEPSQFASLPQLAARPDLGLDPAALQKHWINVAAVDSTAPSQLATYSNACGATMAYCMTAPGDVMVPAEGHTAETTRLRTVRGTDYAAAQVAGAAALVWERFPGFTEEQVQQVLLTTAKDLGDRGVDPVFGWGLLDVAKAVAGPTRFEEDWLVQMATTDYYSFANPISGPGGLTVRGGVSGNHAHLDLFGEMTYEGPTRVVAAALTVEKSLKSSSITIESGGSVQIMGGTIAGDLNIDNGWLYVTPTTFNPPTVIQGDIRNRSFFQYMDYGNTVSFEGNYTQESGGALVYILGEPPAHFAGTATIQGPILLAGYKEGYVAPGRSTVLIADGGITGAFSSAYPYAGNLLIEANIGQNATTVWLDVIRAQTISVATATGLEATALGSAQRIDEALGALDRELADGEAVAAATLEGAAAFQSVRSVAQLDRSLSSLSGELHDMDTAFAMMAIDGNHQALESRLDALDSGAQPGAWSHRMDGMRGWSSFDVNTHGWTLGFDQPGRDGMTIGASLAQTDGDAWHSQRFDRERNRQVDAQLYASWTLGEGGYLLGSAAFGHMQRWLQREVWLGDASYRVSSDYAHRYGALALQSGRRIPFGASVITPYLGVQGLQLAREGFSEEGASGFGLTSDDASMSALQALAGARWSHAWGTRSNRWTLSGRLEWQRLLSQSDASIQARFTGMDAWAPIVADGLDRDVGLFGLGLEAGFGARGTVRFDLDSRYGDGEQWTGAMATWITAF